MRSETQQTETKLNGTAAADNSNITPQETAALDADEAFMSLLRVNLFSAAGLAAAAIPLGVVKAHKPHELFRTHPDASAVQIVFAVTDETKRVADYYAVMPQMVEPLRGLKAKIAVCKFYLTITADGVVRWLVVPQSDNENSWGRMVANGEADRYDFFDPAEHRFTVNLPEPACRRNRRRSFSFSPFETAAG
jgi:hypothetical protein